MTVDESSSIQPNHVRHTSDSSHSPAPSSKRLAPAAFVLTFFIMMAFWLVFSGKFDLFHITLGLVSSLIVAALSADLLFPTNVKPDFPIFWLRFIGYIPWLLYQIFLANLRVLYLTFHPKMHDLIDPNIIEFNSTLKSDVARTTFANSITLTPGTITINVSVLGKFAVHCIDKKSGQNLPGEMESKIARVFKE